MRFGELEDYQEVHGDCNVPKGWIENPPLGNWVDRQRQLSRKGKMDPEREEWLTWLGFSWEPWEENWEEMFRLLVAYKEAHSGDSDVPEGYEVEGVNLGMWVQTQRQRYKDGKMDQERVRRLMELGFKWDCLDEDWEERYWLLAEFKEVHGHCNVPVGHEMNGINLGYWVHRQRQDYKQGKMDPERVRRLRELGFRWDCFEENWEGRCWLLAEFKEVHGHCNVPDRYEVNGIKLGYWVQRQRQDYKQGDMDPERGRRLEDLGFKWDCFEDDWEERYWLLAEFKEVYGHCNVPDRYEVNGIKLGMWVQTQRRRLRTGKMDPERKRRLRELGFSLQPQEDKWEKGFRLLSEFKEIHGHCNVPRKYAVKGVNLGSWVQWQLRRFKEGKMNPDHERRLRELGFSFQ